MTLNASKLKHLVLIDQHASISAAARALGLTQSTLSRSLADIEATVGYALFDRRARDVVPTARGQAFIRRAARIISDLDQLEQDAKTGREAGASLIRVAVSPASMQGLLNRAIRHLVGRAPDYRVHLNAVSAVSGIQALRRGDADILVAPLRALQAEAAITAHGFDDLKTHLFVRHGHPLATKKGLSQESLTRFPLVAPDQMSWHTDQILGLYDEVDGDSARRVHLIEYFPIVADIVENTDAIGVVASGYAQSAAFCDRFEVLDMAFFEPLTIGYGTRKRWPQTPATEAFLHALKECGLAIPAR
ncbi:MAG: LysR family transcriptional regulator [Parvularcula sp.]